MVVLGVSGADDLALGRLGEQLDGARRGFAQHLGRFQAALGPDQHLLATRVQRFRHGSNSPRKRIRPWRTI